MFVWANLRSYWTDLNKILYRYVTLSNLKYKICFSSIYVYKNYIHEKIRLREDYQVGKYIIEFLFCSIFIHKNCYFIFPFFYAGSTFNSVDV